MEDSAEVAEDLVVEGSAAAAEVVFDQVLSDPAAPVFGQALLPDPMEEREPDGQHHPVVDPDLIIGHIIVHIIAPTIDDATIIAPTIIAAGGIAPISGDDTIARGIIPPCM